MYKVQIVRELVNRGGTTPFEEILGLFERTMEESDEFCSLPEENVRLHKLLDAAFNREVLLHRADIQQLLVQQEWRSSLDQEEPEPLHIKKEEQEELLISQEGGQLEQAKREADEEDCGGPEPARNTYPGIHL
ncbi:hypothetical protein LDENG_00257920 [Lucifuga dentata]|nr:hypothetical protein LDENG_00257920 [Lucifuga dentata]